MLGRFRISCLTGIYLCFKINTELDLTIITCSSLGRSDGKVYEDLYHRAHRLNPLNDIIINPDYRADEAELGSSDSESILAKL